MSYLTREIFLKKVEESGSKYWREGKNYRWQYMEYVISILKEICPNDLKLIEAGTNGMPLGSKSFEMEYPHYDLNITPYKCRQNFEDGRHEIRQIKDKEFTAFCALQTWEHLDNQAGAFNEVMRISKSAVLSFPYKWTWGNPRHKGIDGKKIETWTCGVKPVSIKIINHRAIYCWRFEG